MKYIQSFYQYPVTFSSIGKTMPARAAMGEMRNLAEVTEDELETLQNAEPLFRALVNKKKYRVLNKMPEGYKPAAQQINEARAEADALRARVAELEAAAGTKKDVEIEPGVTATDNVGESADVSKLSYQELQEVAKKLGLDYKNVKKSDLIAMIEEATK